ncbi:conserved Plasmodium protein, unknown function [Plasmodium gallinaceum]|uniref:Fam-a protein n=1 Tax=Plasmodium gallinaceum TaxID=5849 RepID=A0A1J1H3U6_PLAGA|nr:conserved Plasmodium protein, unknown function [Plasmodium gallinaceum]CRG98159.1 conserved Plasmodium protein, unknown function [Plasmodium gallinaceum]
MKNFFNFLFLSIFIIKIQNICAITTNEIIKNKRINFLNEARNIINQSNLVDQNEKIMDDSLRTYKYYMLKDKTEIRAIFIFDDLNINKAKKLGIYDQKHKIDILDIQNRVHNLFPLDGISSLTDVLYKERQTFSFNTDYAITNYVFSRFVFNINVHEKNDEEIMSLLLDNELIMKKKNLIIKKNNNGYEANDSIERYTQNSNNLLKNHPHSFSQFIGALLNISSIVTSISGTISAISSLFSNEPSPSPPKFLGEEKAPLLTHVERKTILNKSENKSHHSYRKNNKEYEDEYEDEDEYEEEYEDEYEDEDEDEYDYY